MFCAFTLCFNDITYPLNPVFFYLDPSDLFANMKRKRMKRFCFRYKNESRINF